MVFLVAEAVSAVFAKSAYAQTDAEVFVHVDSEGPVDLGHKAEDADEFTVVCTSPCDRTVPLDGVYRVQSRPDARSARARRLSSNFSLSPESARQTVVFEPKPPGELAGGVVLVSVGGATIVGAMFAAMISSIEAHLAGNDGSVDQTGPLVVGAMGIISVVAGVALLVDHHHTVTVDPSSSAAQGSPMRPVSADTLFPSSYGTDATRLRTEAIRTPAPVTVPLFRIAF